MNSKWLGRNIHTRVKEDPRLGISNIISMTHRKWNVGVCDKCQEVVILMKIYGTFCNLFCKLSRKKPRVN